MSLSAEAEGPASRLDDQVVWSAILIMMMSLTAMAAALIVA